MELFEESEEEKQARKFVDNTGKLVLAASSIAGFTATVNYGIIAGIVAGMAAGIVVGVIRNRIAMNRFNK